MAVRSKVVLGGNGNGDKAAQAPDYLLASPEARSAAQVLVGRIVNLGERHEGRTLSDDEIFAYANDLVRSER